jgi:MFS superfamily sulfate permease-like transporter
MQKYNLKKDLLDDFVSGCTVGVMHIPQGDAFVYSSVAEAGILD